jgi:hypothetical protein
MSAVFSPKSFVFYLFFTCFHVARMCLEFSPNFFLLAARMCAVFSPNLFLLFSCSKDVCGRHLSHVGVGVGGPTFVGFVRAHNAKLLGLFSLCSKSLFLVTFVGFVRNVKWKIHNNKSTTLNGK